MAWTSELNPAPWRDEDERQRRSVPRRPVAELTGVLRASFEVRPLPADMARLLDRLR